MPSIKPPRPVLPPERTSKPKSVYFIVYGAIIMLILGMLSILLSLPTTSH